jgi:hypothetical protein
LLRHRGGTAPPIPAKRAVETGSAAEEEVSVAGDEAEAVGAVALGAVVEMSRDLPMIKEHKSRGSAKKPTKDRVRITTARRSEERRWPEADFQDKWVFQTALIHTYDSYISSPLRCVEYPRCTVPSYHALHLFLKSVYSRPERSVSAASSVSVVTFMVNSVKRSSCSAADNIVLHVSRSIICT